MFYRLFLRKIVSFQLFYMQIVCFCSPPGKFCPPLEKSLRTPMVVVYLMKLIWEQFARHQFSFRILNLFCNGLKRIRTSTFKKKYFSLFFIQVVSWEDVKVCVTTAHSSKIRDNNKKVGIKNYPFLCDVIYEGIPMHGKYLFFGLSCWSC